MALTCDDAGATWRHAGPHLEPACAPRCAAWPHRAAEMRQLWPPVRTCGQAAQR